ncbi:MAG TPA: SagB/ThcOx family dehydrogenase [bacterium]|nr:SagB/ThcOx family dehydrogenase [bacterium]
MKSLLGLAFAVALILSVQPAFGQQPAQPEAVKLVKPQTTGGKPLMQALNERRSQRAFSSKELPPQVLSNLLWAAFGVNRPDGRRTAPSASNRQEIDIYVAMARGLYLYNAKEHRLDPVLAEDIRTVTGAERLVKDTPVVLVFVADYARMSGNKDLYSATDTGYISQNVYLYCASEGLATVVLGTVNREALAGWMKLRPDQKIILTQPVGYPK